jgi:IS5 family transposase
MRRFARVEFGDDVAPDETTILRFRNLLEEHRLTESIFEAVKDLLAEKRLLPSILEGLRPGGVRGAGRALPGEPPGGLADEAPRRALARDQPRPLEDAGPGRPSLPHHEAPVGLAKVRYRGLAKNLARAQTMFALANLYAVRRHLLPTDARCAL